MTGYGEGKEEDEEVEIYLQTKTLNHRFIEIEIYPPQLIPFVWEKKIKEYIRGKIKRGKVILSIEIRRKKPPSPKIAINQSLVFHYYKTLSQISSKLGLRNGINLSHVLSLPEIIHLEKKERINEKNVKNLIGKGLKKAINQVLQMREKEGKEHLYSMQDCLRRIKKNILKIEKEIPLIEKKHKTKIKEILGELADQANGKKILNELSFLTWRSDINEERVRFRSHLDQFQTTLREQVPIGTKLKFILQELQREINTLGAKTNSSTISTLVIHIKEDLERIREESQNIE